MASKSFNLTTDPWIKVINKDSKEEMVSLLQLFENAQEYRQLAGEMRSQDLAILRFLLAILTTVYSRFDADGEPYEWLEIDERSMQPSDESDDEDYDEQDLLDTWSRLYQDGHFSEIVINYLKKYSDRFDLFGDHPFYQVTEDEYNRFVPSKKQIKGDKGPGTVAIKQINRQISESAHTPAIFAPSTGEFKNEIKLDQLVRWLITYQSFTGVTDKTKVETKEKFSTPSGWLYKLNPVFADGKTIFQTLMLNLVLLTEKPPYASQKPVWEYSKIDDYVAERKKQILPSGIAALYTTWSRLLHIDWANNRPIIFSAGVPMFGNEDAFLEPMTVWKIDKKTNGNKPAVKGLRSLGTAMWRNFGQYVGVSQSIGDHKPGIVSWLQKLKNKNLISRNSLLTLASVALISDGNATSQSPVAEVYDDMQINADVLFDPDVTKASYWPKRIEEVIDVTQHIGSDYWRFASDIGQIRNLPDSRTFANHMSAKFYDGLNEPFRQWLAGLTNEDERDQKINLWKHYLQKYVMAVAKEAVQSSTPRDMSGVNKDGRVMNIFTVQNNLRYHVRVDLDLQKG